MQNDFQQVEEKKASHNSQIPGEGVQVGIALGQSLEIEEPEDDMTFSRKVQLMFADYSKDVKSPSDKNSSDYPNPKDAPPGDTETFSARNRVVGPDFASRSRDMRVNGDFIRWRWR